MIPWLKSENSEVITGEANGIGFAAAKYFLDQGMRVLIADVNEDALAKAQTVLDVGSERLLTQKCDVSDLNQIKALGEVALNSFGRIDCLMNNAGISVARANPCEEIDAWKKPIEINLCGIIHGCHTFIPMMLESKPPVAVINTEPK
ncbi:MAG: NAD(P)-dependent dehydrogenase (short-subunit alcohol dehydrogenase family) [Candidatus Azotimanducaceae bacterium]|jgi:NAD(P)-dependent dehydrogenase (short-subunit alcohol dehydrogenase family)